eukprot:6207858-Pleurochrysis_carterae.AAC.3
MSTVSTSASGMEPNAQAITDKIKISLSGPDDRTDVEQSIGANPQVKTTMGCNVLSSTIATVVPISLVDGSRRARRRRLAAMSFGKAQEMGSRDEHHVHRCTLPCRAWRG